MPNGSSSSFQAPAPAPSHSRAQIIVVLVALVIIIAAGAYLIQGFLSRGVPRSQTKTPSTQVPTPGVGSQTAQARPATLYAAVRAGTIDPKDSTTPISVEVRSLSTNDLKEATVGTFEIAPDAFGLTTTGTKLFFINKDHSLQYFDLIARRLSTPVTGIVPLKKLVSVGGTVFALAGCDDGAPCSLVSFGAADDAPTTLFTDLRATLVSAPSDSIDVAADPTDPQFIVLLSTHATPSIEVDADTPLQTKTSVFKAVTTTGEVSPMDTITFSDCRNFSEDCLGRQEEALEKLAAYYPEPLIPATCGALNLMSGGNALIVTGENLYQKVFNNGSFVACVEK